MTLESIHSKIHVELAKHCPDNITDMHNESQRCFLTVIFGKSKVL